MTAQDSFDGGGVRDSEDGKPDFTLLWAEDVPFEEQFLYKLAMHLTEGAKRYAPRNWEKFHTPDALDRARRSKFRHAFADQAGKTDENHLIAEACNAYFQHTIAWKVANGWNPGTGTKMEEAEPDSGIIPPRRFRFTDGTFLPCHDNGRTWDDYDDYRHCAGDGPEGNPCKYDEDGNEVGLRTRPADTRPRYYQAGDDLLPRTCRDYVQYYCDDARFPCRYDAAGDDIGFHPDAKFRYPRD